MSEMRILGRSGDEAVTWTVEDKVATQSAAEVFAKHMLNGGLAFSMPAEKGSKPGIMIEEFDPNAERIILAPVISGG